MKLFYPTYKEGEEQIGKLTVQATCSTMNYSYRPMYLVSSHRSCFLDLENVSIKSPLT
jgi:hypothetical protein